MEAITNISIRSQTDIDVLNCQAEEIVKTNPKSSFELCKKAIESAREISYDKGLAKANLNAGIASRHLSDYDSSFVYFENALRIYKVLNETYGEIRAYNSLANLYYTLSDYVNAIDHFKKCLI